MITTSIYSVTELRAMVTFVKKQGWKHRTMEYIRRRADELEMTVVDAYYDVYDSAIDYMIDCQKKES